MNEQRVENLMKELSQANKIEYIQGQITKIRTESNELMEKHHGTKLKSTCLAERHQKWKEHFKNFLWNPVEITDNLIRKLFLANNAQH